jgi:hypothetical protein
MLARYTAPIGFACGLAAMGWARPYLSCAVWDVGFLALALIFIAAFAVGFAAAGAAKVFQSQGSRRSWARSIARIIAGVATGTLAGAAAYWATTDWVERFGAYAIPRADYLGLGLSVLAIAFGAVSIRVRGRLGVTAAAAIFLGGFVLVTGYLADRFAHSPYFVVRQYAAAAERADQEAMRQLFSRQSLRHWTELPTRRSADGRQTLTTVDRMYPGVAGAALLTSVETQGKTASVELLLPDYWHIIGASAGHDEFIGLVKDNGAWKIDGYGEALSLRKTIEFGHAAERAGKPVRVMPGKK